MAFLNLSAVRVCTEAEGPGKRFAIWCQGCLKKCPGCCNPEMQVMRKNHIVSVKDIEELILKSHDEFDIEGVSFIGGEPMLQAGGFAELALWCHEHNLSVLVFTGFLLRELKDLERDDINSLLNNTDVLVDGPFIQEQYDEDRDWIGSKNQVVHFLSNRYSPGIEFEKQERSMELVFDEDKLRINGWPFLDR